MLLSLHNEATMTQISCDAEANLLDADLFPVSGGPPHELFDASRDQARFTSHDEGFLIWDLDDVELVRQRHNKLIS